jgi:hypothetical protein
MIENNENMTFSTFPEAAQSDDYGFFAASGTRFRSLQTATSCPDPASENGQTISAAGFVELLRKRNEFHVWWWTGAI